MMNLLEFQNKDVVNINNGKKIGNIIDIVISNEGYVLKFILLPNKNIFSFKGKDTVEIDFKNIKKIGEDVILIDYN